MSQDQVNNSLNYSLTLEDRNNQSGTQKEINDIKKKVEDRKSLTKTALKSIMIDSSNTFTNEYKSQVITAQEKIITSNYKTLLGKPHKIEYNADRR